MKKHKGLTFIELLLIIAIIAMLLAIFVPPLSRTKSGPMRTLCMNNIRNLGTAMTMYANNYNGYYPQLPGRGPWSKELGFEYDNHKPDFTGTQANTSRTITASWYLLVRYAEIAPITMICPASDRYEYNGENSKNLEITKLWDFGTDPYNHVSYAMHNPYGKFPAHKKLPGNFAVAADMNPWFLRENQRVSDTLYIFSSSFFNPSYL